MLLSSSALAADFTITSASDINSVNCAYDAPTYTYDCSLDGSGNVWDNIYITNDIVVPRTGVSCNTNSANVIFRAKNDFIAKSINAGGTFARCGDDYSGSGGFVDISAKKIEASSIYTRGYPGHLHWSGFFIVYGDWGTPYGNNVSLKGDYINVSGAIDVSGRFVNNNLNGFAGGTLAVSGGIVNLGDINANGGSRRFGAPPGNIYINATSAKVKSILSSPGRSDSCCGYKRNGGAIKINSGYFESGPITANGAYGQYGGDGGRLDINASDVKITGAVTLNGNSAGSKPRAGGSGGTVLIRAASSAYLSSISVSAGTGALCGQAGAGGKIDIDASLLEFSGSSSANGGTGGNSYSSGCDPGIGGLGGTIKTKSSVLTIQGSISANGGTGGLSDDFDNGGAGGKGGTITLNAVESNIFAPVSALGGTGGRLATNVYRSGHGGTGGTITIVGDTKLNITQPVSVAGGNAGSSFTEASGGSGGPGGKISIYASDPAEISSIQANGGNGAGNPADRTCGSGGAGGKVLVFSDASASINDFTINNNGGLPGVPDPTYGCDHYGTVGAVGSKAKYPRSVDSAFRLISSIKERSTGNNATGSIRTRIFDRVSNSYVYEPQSLVTWQPFAPLGIKGLNTLLGRTAPASIVLGRQYTMEVTVSDDTLFNSTRCISGASTCNTVFIDFVEYYESV